MQGDWVLLKVFQQEYQAAIVEAILKDEGMLCVIHNHKDSAYNFIGVIEVYVKKEDYQSAMEVLENNTI